MWRAEPTPGDKAWVVLGSFIAGYDGLATLFEWDTLSQSCARALDDPLRRWPTVLVIVYIAAHLLRVIPHRYDPLRRWTDAVTGVIHG